MKSPARWFAALLVACLLTLVVVNAIRRIDWQSVVYWPALPPPPPMMLAARRGDEVTVHQLCKSAADANAKDSEGHTAIMHALEGQHYALADWLYAHGSRPEREHGNGRFWTEWTEFCNPQRPNWRRALDWYSDHGYLIPTETDGEGQNALFSAAQSGSTSVTLYFLKLGFDPSARDVSGRQAADYAPNNASGRAVRRLLSSWSRSTGRPKAKSSG